MQQQETTDERQDGHDPAAALEQHFPDFVIDSLPCTFFVISSEMRFVRWNRNLQLLGGYSDEEMRSMNALDIIVEERREAVAEASQKALGGDRVEVDIACRAKDGRIVSLFLTMQRWVMGSTVYLLGTGWDAAHRMASEQKLTDERNLLSTLINNLPDAVYVKDRQSRFTLCNREVLRRKGVGALEEIVGQTDFNFYSEEAAQGVFADEQELMRTGTPMINKERCVIDKVSGRPTWNLTTKVPLRNNADEIIGLVGIGRDITERKQAEEAYHAIVDHSLQGLIVIQDMRIAFANRAMAEISGYSPEEMQTLSAERLRGFVHPLDREKVWGHHQARLNGESLPERYEFRVIRKDGRVRWLEINTSRVEYQGRPAIQAACIDTTERRRTQAALQRSEARNRAFLNANPDLMFRLSRGGVFLDCKPPKDDAIAVSPAHFVGKHLDEVFPPAVTRTLMRHIQAALETGQVQTLEYMLPGTDGEGAEFECRLVACAEREVVAIVRDISERRRAEHLAWLQRDVAIRLSSLSDLKEGLRYCLEAAIRTSRMDAGGIYTMDEHSGCLRLDVHVGLSEDFVEQASTYPPHSKNAQVIMKGESVYTTFDKLGVPLGPVQRAESLRAIGLIPIKHGARIIACLNIASHTIAEVPPRSRMILETVAAQIGSAISRLKIQEALQHSEQEKAIILNTMPEIVTYHDLSHRMIWANRTALEALGKSVEEIAGRRCYELWEDATRPCAGCPVDLALRTGQPQEAEIRGYNDNVWLVRGEPVRDGRGRVLGVVEWALDITKRKQDEEELRRRLQFEELIAALSTDFANLQADAIETGLERALAGIGRFVQADRCYVYLLHDGGTKMSKMHEWCAEGIDPELGRVRDMETSQLPWGLDQLRRTGVLAISSVRELQGETAEAKSILESIGVKSLLSASLTIGEQLFGFLGISAVREERAWPEDAAPLLKMAAQIVANALERKRSADAMRERLAFETLLSELSATFINLPGSEIDSEIERWLARIGACLGIDRGTIAQFADDRVAVTHSWAAPGLERTPAWVADEGFGWSIEQLRRGRILAYTRTEDIPPHAEREREHFLRIGMKSIIVMPLEVAGSVLGAVSFSCVRTPRDWSDELVQRLRLVGQVFANAMLRRRAEEALRSSEARLRSIVRAAPTGIGLVCNRVLLQVNDRICEMVGRGREELVHQSARILYPTDEDFEYVGREKYRQISLWGTGTIETRWRRQDGEIIDVLLSSAPLDPEDVSQGATFVALDITARKRAEEELKNIFNLSLDLVCVADLHTARFTKVNPAFFKTLGYGERELTERTFLEFVHPDDLAETKTILKDRLLAGEEVINFENRYRCKDGSYRWLSWMSHPVPEQGLTYAVAHDVTERRAAEKALQESERKLRTLMSNLPGIAYRCAHVPDWPFEFVSEGTSALTGYAPAEITVGGPVVYGSLIHPEDRAMVWDAIQAAVRQDLPFDLEYRIRTKDGSEKWVFERGRAVPSSRATSPILEGFITDVTERKQAEMALRESESRFRDLADLLPQTVFEADPQGFFTFANRAGLEQFGYTEQEAPHVHVLETIAPADRERAAENVRRRMAGETVSSSEYTAMSKDGRTFPVLLYSVPIVREGKPAGIRGIVVNITELKQAEKALRESEQNYREIFNAANDAFLIHDPVTGAILDVNRKVLETYGYTYEEALQARAGGTEPQEAPYTRAEALARIHKAVEEGPQLFEWLSQKKNGEPIWEEVNLRTASIGGQRRVLAIVRDITDRKKIEEQAQQHLVELTRAWHANTLGEMASGLAHELNQPLCAIVNYSNGCLRLTRREGFSIDTVRDSIARIAAQAQRAADILKRIRGLIGRHEPQRAELDLESILGGAVSLLKDEAAKRNVAIVSRLQANLPRIKGDNVEIEQVVLNLMRNAVEAMDDPQISQRKLTISSRLSDGRRIEVAVADTGRGIAAGFSDKIFESFFTTKSQGLGIGLSLSRRIVEAHGGRLWAESDGGAGATFKFTLPVEGGPHGE